MKLKAVILDSRDNVGVALMDLESGIKLDLKVDRQAIHVNLVEPVSYQHKFSVVPIRKGDRILKYGQVIGEATADIGLGEHVHVHNMVGLRLKAAGRA